MNKETKLLQLEYERRLQAQVDNWINQITGKENKDDSPPNIPVDKVQS
jgi:hypothetical protein